MSFEQKREKYTMQIKDEVNSLIIFRRVFNIY